MGERIALHGGVDERELFEGRHLGPRVPGRAHRLGVHGESPARRELRRLWTAATVSNLGDGVTLAALPLLAASLTRSPTSIAVVTFAGTLPWLLFALLSGALADRLDRRRTMVLVDAFRMLVMAGLAVLVLTDADSLLLVGVVAFVLGSAETLFDNSAQSILPSIVERDSLETANGRVYAAEVVTNQFVGPPVGAFLFAATAAAPFFLDAGSFGLAALVMLGVRGSFRPVRDGRPTSRSPSIRADIAEGMRWLWRNRCSASSRSRSG